LPEMKHAVNETVTYHDACHLAHAQKVTTGPRQLLASVPGLKLVPLPESDMCCGAAGTYNLTQPEMSEQLAERKLNNIASTHAGVDHQPLSPLFLEFVLRQAQIKTNLCSCQSFEHGYTLEPRTVPDYNYIFCRRGVAVWEIDGDAIEIKPGDLVIVPPGVRHR